MQEKAGEMERELSGGSYAYKKMRANVNDAPLITQHVKATADAIKQKESARLLNLQNVRVIHPQASQLTTHQEFAKKLLYLQTDEKQPESHFERILKLFYELLLGIPDIARS